MTQRVTDYWSIEKKMLANDLENVQVHIFALSREPHPLVITTTLAEAFDDDVTGTFGKRK